MHKHSSARINKQTFSPRRNIFNFKQSYFQIVFKSSFTNLKYFINI